MRSEERVMEAVKLKVLSRSDLERILDMKSVVEGVRNVYRLKAEGETEVWPLVAYEFEKQGAVMDIRSGAVLGSEQLHGLKMLNNFPRNKERHLPVFTGVLMVFDSETGLPLGIMDASYITGMRTGAAGAIGASVLARKDSKVLTVLGAGRQAMFQIAAMMVTMPQIDTVYVADEMDKENEKRFAAACRENLKGQFGIGAEGVEFKPAGNLAETVGKSDVIITVTPSRKPVIRKEWVKPGTHFSCIGADMEGKEEIDPEIFAGAAVFADDRNQCIRVGEMEIPVKTGVIAEEDVKGEIGQVLTGSIPGRGSAGEITIFDATGLALLDLVTGKKALDGAWEKGVGLTAEI